MSEQAQPQAPRRGRPKADEPRTSLSTWIAASDHDRLIKLANQRETSVSGLVRQMLQQQLRNR